MKTVTGLVAIALVMMIGATNGVSAKEYNKRPHLDPGSQAKVNSVIAKGHRLRGTRGSNFRRITNQGCGGLTIGAIGDTTRPPREVIIVARDIININTNC
jgi:hypothetical protein